MNLSQFNLMLNEYRPCRNPTLLSTVFNTIIDKLKVQVPNQKQQKDLYDFLVDKCINEEDADICTSAAIALTLQKYISDDEIMISLMSALPYAKNINSIVKTTSILCMRSEADYTVHSNQHPLIKVIWQNSTSLEFILNIIYSTEPSKLKQFEAVLLYIIIGHDYKIPDKIFNQLWIFLSKSDHIFQQLRIASCGALCQLTNKSGLDRTLNLLQSELNKEQYSTKKTISVLCGDRIVFILATLLNEALKQKILPLQILKTLKQASSDFTQFQCPDLIIIQLAEIALILPSIYVNDLISVFSNITRNAKFYNGRPKIFVETILKWKLFPLLAETGIKIDFVYDEGPKFVNLSDELEDDLVTNKHYCNALQIMELLDLSDDNLLPVLNCFDNLSIDFLKEYVILFIGILSNNTRKAAVIIKAIELLTKLCDTYNEWTSTFLAIILSKLSQHLDPTVLFKLLKTLPKMGKRKENLRHIIGILKLISKSKDSHMKSTALSLMYDLWAIDSSCYKILQELLFEEHPNNVEFNITRAYVLKELCRIKPELYFAELLPFLSKILNQSNTPSSLLTIFALEGLSHLVVNDFIHADTIWNSIKPRFEKETNIQILQSYFKWILNLNQLDCDNEKIQNTLIDAATVLWNAVLKYDNVYVIKSAFDALNHFSLEILNKSMPHIFANGHNEDNFSVLPSKCWMNILLLLPNRDYIALSAGANLLISLVRREIAGYRRHVYMIGGNQERKREPTGFKTLPYHSILVGISSYILTNSTPEKLKKVDPVMIQCLRVLVGESSGQNAKETPQKGDEVQALYYSKPLPPHNWSFLQELIHIPEYKSFVLDIICHQVSVSGSARRLLENYLSDMQEIGDHDSCLLSRVNLFYLCNSIQPSILQPFLANGIIYCCGNGVSDLKKLISNYMHFMNDKNASESNKYSLINIAKEYLPELNAEEKITEILLPLIARAPDATLQEYLYMNNDSITDTATVQNRFKVYVMIKCQRIISASKNAETDNAFKHLDNILDYQKFIDFDFDEEFLCGYLEQVYVQVSVDYIIKFLFNIIGKTEQLLVEDGKISSSILYYCQIFIKIIIYLSQYRDHICFRDFAGCIHFGHALQTLAQKDNTDWKDLMPQILEWIWYMTKKLNDPKCNQQTNRKSEYCRMTLRYGLYALRGEPCFIAKWPKYLETAHDMLTNDWIDN